MRRSLSFIDAIAGLQRDRQIRASCQPDEVQFHDRCAVCTVALAAALQAWPQTADDRTAFAALQQVCLVGPGDHAAQGVADPDREDQRRPERHQDEDRRGAQDEHDDARDVRRRMRAHAPTIAGPTYLVSLRYSLMWRMAARESPLWSNRVARL